MNWLWPRVANDENSVVVRVGRVMHWSAIGLALFGIILTMYTLIWVEGGDPLTYFAVSFVWVSVAMLGRGALHFGKGIGTALVN